MTFARVAGDFDYETLGATYGRHRRTDPRIAAIINDALGSARTVLNVGAGAGSYEPADRQVLAIEPSAAMRAQRPPDAAPVISAVAEALPVRDQSVDASMALVTVHQWTDLKVGLAELRRVTRGPILTLTFDNRAARAFWLNDYAPELIDAEGRRDPGIDAICANLGGQCEVRTVPIPIDCVDGFTEALYARPEKFLDSEVRRAQSAWAFVAPGVENRFAHDLQADLASGEWDRRYGGLRSQPFYEGSLRLIVADANKS